MVSQILTLYTTPVVYLLLERIRIFFSTSHRQKPTAGLTAQPSAAI
jgi:hypothetical protein